VACRTWSCALTARNATGSKIIHAATAVAAELSARPIFPSCATTRSARVPTITAAIPMSRAAKTRAKRCAPATSLPRMSSHSRTATCPQTRRTPRRYRLLRLSRRTLHGWTTGRPDSIRLRQPALGASPGSLPRAILYQRVPLGISCAMTQACRTAPTGACARPVARASCSSRTTLSATCGSTTRVTMRAPHTPSSRPKAAALPSCMLSPRHRLPCRHRRPLQPRHPLLARSIALMASASSSVRRYCRSPAIKWNASPRPLAAVTRVRAAAQTSRLRSRLRCSHHLGHSRASTSAHARGHGLVRTDQVVSLGFWTV
jgi:hypothetical protein